MRLIDAELLHSKLFEIGCHKSKLHPMDVMKMIEEEPTAYDIDKVVEEIEKANQGCCNYCGCDLYSDDAIEIVKQGGASDDVCKWKQTSTAKYKTECGYKLEEYVEQAYNKAIDDFAKLVEIWCWKHEQYNQDDLNKLMNIAEQLKAGDEE